MISIGLGGFSGSKKGAFGGGQSGYGGKPPSTSYRDRPPIQSGNDFGGGSGLSFVIPGRNKEFVRPATEGGSGKEAGRVGQEEPKGRFFNSKMSTNGKEGPSL